MDPTTTTTEPLIVTTGNEWKTWEAKAAFRWLKRRFIHTDGESFTLTLQQAWVCRETGEVEWKDIPEVSE